MRQEIPPSEFSEDLLSTAAEADPIAVAEFKAELRGLELPPEALDVLNQMIDEVLASLSDIQRFVRSIWRKIFLRKCFLLPLILSSLAL